MDHPSPLDVRVKQGGARMILGGENPGHLRQGNARIRCITPQSPLSKVDQWGVLERRGRAAYTRLDHHPQLWQPHEVLVQSRVLRREERGENTLPNFFPKLFNICLR